MEAVKQVAVADRILLTKSDIVDERQCLQTERRIRALNPGAPILPTVDGEVDPDLLFDVGFYDPSGKIHELQRWLDDKRYVQAEGAGDHHHADHAGGSFGHDHIHDVNRHDEHIHAMCLVFEEPIPGEALDNWLKSLFRLRGPDLLRFKAIINVAELPGPLVLHGVQHVIHPPKALKCWPSDDRRTRMVFITYDMDEFSLRSSFQQFVQKRT
jgi:G3E family GTPase